MNKCCLVGRVGSAELNTDKTPMLKVSLAVNEKFKDKSGEKKERTDWFNLVVFGDRAASLAPYINKGDQLSVTGKIRMGSYEKDGVKRYTTDIVVDEVGFLGKSGGSHATDSAEDHSDGPSRKSVPDNSIPF